ncbi:MAG: prolyl oligopeptidase family serine peptidase, partial [Ignavibacteria bacterium]|nr:prolyl oligopeptidase family serine peptidase [Ignavibacteria bacterium]
MKKIFLTVIVLFIACTSFAQLNYPNARKTDHTDDYFGTKVEDPYRWMEDLNSSELKTWIEEENKVTFSYLDKIPFRDKIRKRLTEIWNYPKYGAPFRIGEYYFFYKNDGMRNQSVLYFQKKLNGAPEVFLDPNTFSTDGTVALSTLSGSKDGKYLVYGVSKAGSDWNEFFVMEIATKTKLKDHLKWVKFSGASWLGDGFYYNRYDAPVEGQELASINKSPKVYFHKAGTEQSEDVLIYEDKEHPEYSFSIYPSEDSRFLYLSKSKKGATGNELYYRDLTKDNSDFIPVSTGFVHQTSPVNNIEGNIYLFTNKDAPKNKIVKFNTSDGSFTDIIPEKKEVLSGASISHEKFFVQYMVDVSDRIYVYDLNGNQIEELKLPALGTVSGYSAKKTHDEIFFTFTSFLYPSVIMKYDIVKNELSEFRKSEVKFDPENYETKQVFYKSKDGTRIPMYIVHKKGLVLDGNNPTLLYAYGGFNASMKPSFSTSNIVLLENGGIYALANIRGGGEYGKEWHMSGTQLK